jgi:Short-chain dehydrogenases of various substrate specificities
MCWGCFSRFKKRSGASARKGGSIVNIGSGAGTSGPPMASVYSATKAKCRE